MLVRISKWVLIAAVLIQLIPYGRNHTNPPAAKEPAWNSSATRALIRRACFDCHSNQTSWPWYSRIAPVSWLVLRDVDVGRARLNFSEWDQPQRGTRPQSIERRIQRGSMPPWYYLPMHSDARLSETDKQALLSGLQATIQKDPPPMQAEQSVTPGREG